MAFFRFVDLPREVRDLVYGKYAKCTRVRASWYGDDEDAWTWAASIVETDPPTNGLKYMDRKAGLLSTSRQLREEMIQYVGANTTLQLSENVSKQDIFVVLRKFVLSAVSQQLRHVELDLTHDASIWQDCSRYPRVTEPLLDAFPGLQHVMMTERDFISVNANSESDEELEAAVKSHVWKYHHEIEAIFGHFQSKGLDLAIRLENCVNDLQRCESYWVRWKINGRIHSLMHTYSHVSFSKPQRIKTTCGSGRRVIGIPLHLLARTATRHTNTECPGRPIGMGPLYIKGLDVTILSTGYRAATQSETG